MSFDSRNPKVSPKATCSQCGQLYSTNDMIHYGEQWICSDCKSLFFQKLKEGLSVPGTLHYGGFWIRSLAKALDTFFLFTFSIVSMMIFFILGFSDYTARMDAASFKPELTIISTAIQLVITLGYPIFFVGKYDATPGKMICHLKIITSEGERVSYGRAAARMFAEMLSSLILSIGYLMAAFDDEKKTLHDIICNTRVIRTYR
jgi:uncharacterized RDD family membrane protein YckC